MYIGRGKYLSATVLFAALVLCVAPVHAAWLTWDTATAGNPVAGGDGTWDDNTTANWTTDGGTTKVNWTPNDGTNGAIFSVGTGTITVAGSGINTLGIQVGTGAAYTFSGGPLTVGSSGVVLGAGGTISSNVTLNGNQTWTIGTDAATSTMTVGGAISGTGNITFNAMGSAGTGLIVLNSANTYNGTTTIGGGSAVTVLKLGNATNTLPTGTVLTLSGSGAASYLDLNGSAQTLAGLQDSGTAYNRFIVNTSGTGAVLTVNNGGNYTFSGIIGGTGTAKNISLVKGNTGTLTLTAPNTFSGGASISQGTIAISNASALGSGTFLMQSNVSAGNMATLYIYGSGGNVNLTNPIRVDQSSGRNWIYSMLGSNTLSGNIQIVGSSIFVIGNNAASGTTFTVSGPITGSSGVQFSLRGNSGANGVISNNLTLLSANTVDINGASNWTFSGTSNTWGKTEILSSGNVVLGATNAMPITSMFGASAGTGTGILDMYGYNQTLTGLYASSGTRIGVSNTSGTGNSVLTLNGSGQTFGGNITNGTSGKISLVMNSGIQTLSGTNNFSGNLTINASGTLRAGSPSALGAGTLNLNGGTLYIASDTSLNSSSVSMTADSTIFLGRASTGAGITTTLGALTSTGGNYTLRVYKDANIVTGEAGLTFNGSWLPGNISATTTQTFDVGAGAVLTMGGTFSGQNHMTLVKTGTGRLVFNAGNTAQWDATAGISLYGGTLDLRVLPGDTADYRSITTGTASTALILSAGTSAGMNYFSGLTVNGNISIASDRLTSGAALTQNLGTLTVNGTGFTVGLVAGTNVSSGTAGLIFGTSPAATTTLVGPAVFDTAANTNLTLGSLVGTAGLSKQNSGVLTIAGTGTAYTGAVTLSSGTLALTNASAIPNSVLYFNGGALSFTNLTAATLGGLSSSQNLALTNTASAAVALTLNYAATGSVTYSGNFSGAGSIIKTGSGVQILTGTNTQTGGTTIAMGALNINGDQALGAATGSLIFGGSGTSTLQAGANGIVIGANRPISINPGQTATFDTNNNAVMTIAGTISGSGSIAKTGTGMLLLTATNSYRGSTTISGGTLQLGSNGASLGSAGTGGAGFIVVNAGGTLDLNGQTTSATINLGGTGTIINSSSTPAVVLIDTPIAGNGFIDGTGDITLQRFYNSSTITKNGAGTLTLAGTGDNTSLTMIINAGRVDALKSSGSGGSRTFANVTLNTGGTLRNVGTGGMDLWWTTFTMAGGTFDLYGHDMYLATNSGYIAGTGAAAGIITNNGTGLATLTLKNNASIFGGTITDGTAPLAIAKVGGSALTLTNTNSFTGGLTLNGGAAVNINGDQALGAATGAITFSGSGIIQLATGIGPITLNAGRNIVTNAGAMAGFDTNSNASLTIAGFITGSGGIVKVGTGSLILTGTQDYYGNTQISGGYLQLVDASGNLRISPNSTLDIQSGAGSAVDFGAVTALTLGGLSGSQALSLTNTTAGRAGVALTVGGNAQNTTYSGNLSGTGASITKVGSGTLTLSGANTFTNGVTANYGTIKVGSTSALGSGTAVFNAGSTLDVNGIVTNNMIYIQGNGGPGQQGAIDNNSATQQINALRNVTLMGDTTFATDNARWDIRLSGTGFFNGNGYTLTKAGTASSSNYIGLVSLGETNLGDIHIVSGRLNFENGTTLGQTDKTLTLESAGVLGFYNQGNAQTKNIISNGGTFTTNSAAFTINGTSFVLNSGITTADSASGNITFGHTISGTGSIAKTSGNSLIFTGSYGGGDIYTVSGNVQFNTATASIPSNPTLYTVGTGSGLASAQYNFSNIGATGTTNLTIASALDIGGVMADSGITITRAADYDTTVTIGSIGARNAGDPTGLITLSSTYGANNDYAHNTLIVSSGSVGILDRGWYYRSPIGVDFAYRAADGTIMPTMSLGGTLASATDGSVGLSANTYQRVTGSVSGQDSVSVRTLNLIGPAMGITMNDGATLTLSEGGIISQGGYTLGNDAVRQINTISGGTLAGSGELSVRTDQVTDNLAINSAISGFTTLTKSGSGMLFLGGTTASSLTSMSILSGAVVLQKSGGAQAVNGDITIGDASGTDVLQLGASNQIPDTSNIIFHSGGSSNSAFFRLNGFNETVAAITTPAGWNISTQAVIESNAQYGTATLTVNNNSAVSYSGNIRDSSWNTAVYPANLALVKDGTGTLTIGASGCVLTYTGGTTVKNGTLRQGGIVLGNGSVTTSGDLTVYGGATFDLNSTDAYVDSLNGAGLVSNYNTTAKWIYVGGQDGSSTWTGLLANGTATLGFAKLGNGTFTFSGTQAQTFSGNFEVRGGTVAVDMSNMASPTNMIVSSQALKLGGGFSLKGAASGASSQTFTGMTLGTSCASSIVVDPSTGTGTTLALGAITRSGWGSTIDFSSTGTITTSTAAVNGLLGGGYATVGGSNWAALSGSTIVAYTGYDPNGLAGLATGTAVLGTGNYLQTASVGIGTGAANYNFNTLKLAPTGASQTIAIPAGVALGAGTIGGVGGVLFDGTNYGMTIAGTGAGQFGFANSEIILNTIGANALTISASLGGTSSSVTKTGSGIVVLSGTSAFTGNLRVLNGTVSVPWVNAQSTAGPLGNGGTGNIFLGGGAGNVGTIQYAGALNGTTDKKFTMLPGGYGAFDVQQNYSLVLSGVIDGQGGLIKKGTGILRLGGANTYNGQTIIQSGKVVLDNAAGLGASYVDAEGTVVQSGATLDLNSYNGIYEVIHVAGAGSAGSIGALQSEGGTDRDDSIRFLVLDANASVGSTAKRMGVINGYVQGNGYVFNKVGTNTLTLRNVVIDNLGDMNINAGTVSLQYGTILGGGAGRLINVGTGCKIEINTGGSTDRTINVLGTGTVSNAGNADATFSGPINLLTNGIINASSWNTYVGSVVGSGKTLNKTGGGTLVLTGTSDFSNQLYLSGGTTKLNTATGALVSTLPVYINGNGATLVMDNVGATVAESQNFGSLTWGGYDLETVQSVLNAPYTQTTTFTAIGARSARNTIGFFFTGGTAGVDNKIVISGTGATPNGILDRGIYVNGTDFAFADTNRVIRGIYYGTDYNSALSLGGTGLIANRYTKVSGNITGQTSIMVPTLNMDNGSSITMNDSAQTLSLAGSGLYFGGIIKSGLGSATISGGTLALGSTGELVIRTAAYTDSLTINSNLGANVQSLTKTGFGTLTLGGSNVAPYLYVLNGMVNLASNAALGAGSASMVSNLGTIGLQGGITVPNAITVNGDGFSANGVAQGALRSISGNNTITGKVTLAGGSRLFAVGTASLTLNQVDGAQDLNLVALDPGSTVTLQGTGYTSGNTKSFYREGAGTVIIKTLSMASNGTGVTSFRGGSTILDLTNSGTGVISSLSPVSLNATQLTLLGKSSGASGQSFALTNLGYGQTTVKVDNNGGAGATLNLGVLNLTSGTLVFFDPNSTGTVTTTNTNTNNILGGRATWGNEWAAVSGSSPYTIGALASNDGELPATGATTAGNYQITASNTVTASQTANTLKIIATGASQTLTIGTGATLGLTSGGLLMTGPAFTINGPGNLGSNNQELIINQNSANDLTISAPMSIGNGTFTRGGVGSGKVILTGNTTTSGSAFLTTGETRLDTGASFKPANVYVGGYGGDATLRINGGLINVGSGGAINVSNYASRGTVIQDGGSVIAANISMNQDIPTTTATYTLNGGTIDLINFLQVGKNGPATFNQSGGTINIYRTTDVNFLLGGQPSTNTATASGSTYNMTGGVLNVNGYYAQIGRESRSYGTLNISGNSVASFRSGLIMAMKDSSGGEVNQTGGTVNVATGLNQNLGEALPGGQYRDVGLVIGMNVAWTSNGYNLFTPARARYNLSGGELRANDITSGQGADAALNWSGGTIRPYDSSLEISSVPVVLTGNNNILSSVDQNGVAQSVMVSAPISGAGGIIFSGSGTINLSGSNSFSGASRIIGGSTVQALSDNYVLGSTSLTLGGSGAGVLRLNGNTVGVSSVAFADAASMVTNGTGTASMGTLSMIVSGTGTFDHSTLNGTPSDFNFALGKTGPGTLTITGTSKLNGGLAINQGTVIANSDNVLGANGAGITFIGNSTLSTTGSPTLGSSRTITLNSGVTGTLDAPGGSTMTVNSLITGAGSLTKTGTGTVVLAGSNNFSGGVTVSNGYLKVLTAGAVGSGSVSVPAGGSLRIASPTFSQPIYTNGSSFNGDGSIAIMDPGLGQVVVSSPITVGGAGGDFKVRSGGSGSSLLLTGGITATGGNSITIANDFNKNDPNGLIVSTNPINLTTGGTLTASTMLLNVSGNTMGTITPSYGGLVRIGADNVFVNQPALNFSSSQYNATFDLNGHDVTVGSLTASLNSASLADTINVTSSNTLTVNGAVTLGYNGTATSNTKVNFTGGGNLVVNGTSNFQVGGYTGSSSSTKVTTVDMTGLSSFTANLGTGTFRIGDTSGSTGSSNNTLLLPANNSITAATINFETGLGGTQALTLGGGVNTLYADTFNLGLNSGGRNDGLISFGTNSTGSLTIRARNGTGRANLNLSSGSGATGASPAGIIDLTGHSADLLLDTLNMTVRQSVNSAGGGTGVLKLTSGSLDVTTVKMAIRPVGTGNNNTSVAYLNIGGGVVSIGTGGIEMSGLGWNNGAGSAQSFLNFTGGTISLGNDIIRLGGTGVASTAATLTLDGSDLNMQGFAIGDANNPITTTFSSGTLENVGSINGTGGLTKTGTGVLYLLGTNSYTGATTVNGGVLKVNGALVNSSLTVANGGYLNGNGLVGSSVVVQSGGHFAPGNSIGTLSVTGDLTLDSGSNSDFELGTPGTRLSPGASDRSVVSGSLTLGGTLNLIDNAGANGNGSMGAGSYKIFTYGGTGTGSFTTVNQVSPYHSVVVNSPADNAVFVDVYRLASGSNTPSLTFGNSHVGDTMQQTITLTNTAANDGYSEKLDASLTGTGHISTSGTVSLLAPGSSDTSSLKVNVDTSSAGHKSGTVTVLMNSNGSGTSGFGTTSLTSGTVTVNGGDVYNYAEANTIATPVNLNKVIIGGTATTKLSVGNIAPAGSYTEGLDASIGTVGSGLIGSGSFTNLAAGSTNTTSLTVGLDTTSVGAKSGTVQVQLASNGTNSGLPDTTLTSQNVNVSGMVLDHSKGSLYSAVDGNQRTYDFGTVNVSTGTHYLNVTLYNLSATLDPNFTADLRYVSREDHASSPFTLDSANSLQYLTNLKAGDGTGYTVQLELETGTTGMFSGYFLLTLGDQADLSGSLADQVVRIDVTANVVVPEPATMGLLLLGGLGVLARRRRRA